MTCFQLPGIGSGEHRRGMKCMDEQTGGKGKLNGKLTLDRCSCVKQSKANTDKCWRKMLKRQMGKTAKEREEMNQQQVGGNVCRRISVSRLELDSGRPTSQGLQELPEDLLCKAMTPATSLHCANGEALAFHAAGKAFNQKRGEDYAVWAIAVCGVNSLSNSSTSLLYCLRRELLGCGEPLALQCCPSQWLRRAEETNPSGASHGVHGKSGQATHPQTLGWTAMTTTEGKCPAPDWQGGMCWEQGWGQHSPGVVCTLHVLVLCTADKIGLSGAGMFPSCTLPIATLPGPGGMSWEAQSEAGSSCRGGAPASWDL